MNPTHTAQRIRSSRPARNTVRSPPPESPPQPTRSESTSARAHR